MTITITVSVDNAAELPRILRQLSANFADSTTAAECNNPSLPLETTPTPAVLPAEEAPKRRGRPPGKKAEPVATVEEFPAEEPATPTPAGRPVDVATLRHTMIEVVKQKGRDACGELCRKHGGPNLSALNPAVYPALYADAQALLATDAQ